MKSCIEIKLENGRVDTINLLKGFSIITIVLMHLIQLFTTAAPSGLVSASSIGGTGVHIFIICSAIGLYLSQLKKPQSFLSFMKKRFLFIYIPYILVVLITCLIPWMYAGEDLWMAFLSHAFLYKMFLPQYNETFGPFWFISTIFQLYLLFIPMCFLKKKIKKNWLFVGIFLLISIAWWTVTTITKMNDQRIWSSFCLQYIWEFALGIVIAELLMNGKVFKLNILLLLSFSFDGLALQAIMAMAGDSLKSFNDIPGVIGYGSLALLIVHIPGIKWCVNKVSFISYEVYLTHMLIFSVIFHFINSGSFAAQLFIGIAALIAILIVSYLYNLVLKLTLYKLKSRPPKTTKSA